MNSTTPGLTHLGRNKTTAIAVNIFKCVLVNEKYRIGIDTKIEVIVMSPTTWEAHHSPSRGRSPKAVVSFSCRW